MFAVPHQCEGPIGDFGPWIFNPRFASKERALRWTLPRSCCLRAPFEDPANLRKCKRSPLRFAGWRRSQPRTRESPRIKL